jgi:Sec-independent protein secretion pathway component TatC
VKIGILDAAKLSKFRSYWVVAGLLIAAFITPDGNPLNMLLLFLLSLHLLYEISLVIAWWWNRKAAKAAANVFDVTPPEDSHRMTFLRAKSALHPRMTPITFVHSPTLCVPFSSR